MHKEKIGALSLLLLVFSLGCLQAGTQDKRLKDKVLWLNNNHADSLFLCQKTAYYYNPTYPSRVDSIVRYSYQPYYEDFVPDIRYIYHYDATGEYVVRQEDYISGLEIPQVIYLFDYDSQHRLTSVSHTSWDHDNNCYYQYSRYHFLYNGDTLAEAYMADFFHWGENYYYYYRQTFDRDSQGRITSYYQSNSTDSLNWTVKYRYNYSFSPVDVSDNTSLVEYLRHGFVFDQYGSLFCYDKVGMIQTSSFQYMDSGNWAYQNKAEYEYDNHHRLTSQTSYQLYFWTEWRPKVQYNYTYDNNGNLSDYYLLDWDNDAQDWEFPREHWIYTWETIPGSVPPAPHLELTAYPNPFYENLNIQVESVSRVTVSISIYNAKGQKVRYLGTSSNSLFTWDGKNSNNQPVSNGIYFIRAEQDGKAVTKKVIRIN